MAPTAVVTAKMPPSALTQTSLQRTGSYGRDQRGSRRARRQVQRAERDADAITRPSDQTHRFPQTRILPSDLASSDMADEALGVEFSTDPDETSATLSPALPEARRSLVGSNHQHDINDSEGSGEQKHVVFEENGGPSAQVTRKSHGRHQEGLDLTDDPYTEAAEMYDAEIPPSVQHRPHRREKSRYQQGTYHQGLDISVHEAEMLRNLEIVPSGRDRMPPRTVDLSHKETLEKRMTPELAPWTSERHGVYQADMRMIDVVYREQLTSTVKKPAKDSGRQRVKSKARDNYQMGLNLVESSQSDAE